MKGVIKNIDELFKLIVESSYDGIYVTDGNANTIFLNQSYENITGINKKDLIGKNMKTLVKNGIFNESSSLVAIKERKKVTINQKLKSGKNILVTGTPVFDENNNIIYVVTNVRDMKELEKLEKELFGYEKGAFTGALASGKKGVFELANNSTLFLDEISELSLETQAKLLKVLETGKFLRIGGEKFITTNVRIVTASNANIEELIKEGKFRKDLFYRINVINITIPPIRERKEDILPLMIKFLKFYNQKYNLDKKISEEVFELLQDYKWPGNIREIRNLIEHMVVVSKDEEITVESIPSYITNELIKKNEISKMELLCTCCFQIYTKMGLKDATEQFQKDVIKYLMEKGYSKSKVAKMLNVNPSTVTRKFQK